MLDLTIKQYIEIIEGLTVSDLIIYYFAVYYFIILIQKALNYEVDTGGKIKTNPKILITLIIIQIFQFIHTNVVHFSGGSASINTLFISGFIIVAILFLIEILLFSKHSVVIYIYRHYINKTVSTQLNRVESARDSKLDQLRKSKEQLISARGRAGFDYDAEVDRITKEHARHINKVAITNRACSFFEKNRDAFILLVMDIYISIVLIGYTYNLNWALSVVFTIYALFFLKDKVNIYYKKIIKQSEEQSEAYLLASNTE